MPVIVLFVHGWGFDASFWHPVIAHLPELDCRTEDRGYFGAPDKTAPDGPHIVVAHSFGAMRMLAAPPDDCRGMLAINGFDRFATREGAPGVRIRVLDRMIARLASDPAAVVRDFRTRCGTDAPFGQPDVPRLKADLETLRDADCTGANANWAVPLISLHGANDPLLPAAMRETAFSACPDLTRDTIQDGGHLLPMTHRAYCAAAIANLVERAA